MNILCPQSVSAKKKKKRLIRELVQGQEAATQLEVLLQKPFGTEGSLSAEKLVANVLRSFTETLSVLTSSELGVGEVAQNLLNSGDDPKPKDSAESRKRSKLAKKDRRGCYKRRKTAQTWNKVSHTPDDNHSWRKYGQKDILNSKFPRSYFRCTRKHDQGCQATKQVQQIQGNPDMYQTTYIGLHTCKDTPKATNLVTDSLVTDSGAWESFLKDYHSDSEVPNEQDHPVSSPNPTIKQEYPKEDTPSDLTYHKLDPSLWSDLRILNHPNLPLDP